MTPHRPAVRRWATCWAVVCDTCHDGHHYWHWDFPDQPTAMRYAIIHADLSRTFGSHVSLTIPYAYDGGVWHNPRPPKEVPRDPIKEPGGRPKLIKMENR